MLERYLNAVRCLHLEAVGHWGSEGGKPLASVVFELVGEFWELVPVVEQYVGDRMCAIRLPQIRHGPLLDLGGRGLVAGVVLRWNWQHCHVAPEGHGCPRQRT